MGAAIPTHPAFTCCESNRRRTLLFVAARFNDSSESFMERYSDLLYPGAAALSIIGSVLVGLYTRVAQVALQKAGETGNGDS
jgi:hypothetical protein